MTLGKNEFTVLSRFARYGQETQRMIADETKLSLGSVNAACKLLTKKGYVAQGAATEAGLDALSPYRVDNALIMAAGLSSRFAPISYEKPKGLLMVRGEVLIERQIRQLLEAGIDDITVVVGYKKEYFFYLEDVFGVHIVVNDEYATRNNHSTLMVAKDQLKRTYICSSDVYYCENPFDLYAYEAYYSAQYCEGPTREWCIRTGVGDRIVSVSVGGCDAWFMVGHAFFDQTFSDAFTHILTKEYNDPAASDKLWEELYIDHIKKLDMVMRPYPPNLIYEFDTLDELREFDPFFLKNVDSNVFDHISTVLLCDKEDVCDVYPLKQGLTNLSCHFRVGENEYVYRHPGVGTEQIIDRASEVAALKLAKELGLDDTFIYEDPAKGWKVSRFIPNCRPFDPHDRAHVKRAMGMARTLHDQAVTIDHVFDFVSEGKRYERILKEKGPIEVPGYYEFAAKIERLKAFVDEDKAPLCLNHNDFFMLNFLLDTNDDLHLIDWEYAGMSDYANDFGTFTVCCQLTQEEAEVALSDYFEREPTFEERRHNFAFVAFAGWCWYVWSLFKEAEGEFIGEWLYVYYRYAKQYLDIALPMYERGCEMDEVTA